MKKTLFIVCFSAMLLLGGIAAAGVNFIVQAPKGNNQSGSQLPKIHTCLQNGYNLRSCPSGHFPNKKCPDDSTYYDKCCDGNVYKYSSSSVCARIGMLPKAECGGKYSCVEP